MKVFEPPYCRQGDLSIFAVESIPDGIEQSRSDRSDGRHTLAHSETGHCHVIDGNNVRKFDVDDFESFIEVEKPSNVVHLRGFDTHETIKLPPGKYRVTRQREYTPEGFRRAAD